MEKVAAKSGLRAKYMGPHILCISALAIAGIVWAEVHMLSGATHYGEELPWYKDFFQEVILIYLPYRVDRFTLSKQILDYHKIKATYWEASMVDSYLTRLLARTKNWTKVRAYDKPRKMRQIACFASHVEVFRHIQRNKIERTLVLEDDFDLDIGFKQKISKIHLVNWDILFLGHCNSKPRGQVGYGLYNIHWLFCTHGYIVTLKFVNAFLTHNESPDLPIDKQLMQFVERDKNVTALMMVPKVIIQRPRTKLNPSEVDKKQKPLRDQTLANATVPIIQKALQQTKKNV